MSLLSLQSVTVRFPPVRPTARERAVLRDASMEIHAGEFIAVWGSRRPIRWALLQICAGLRTPDAGVVRFEGQPMSRPNQLGVEGGIGLAHSNWNRMHGVVVEQVATPLLKTSTRIDDAHERAYETLERVHAADYAEMPHTELEPAELARVMIARALVVQPRLMLLDIPAADLPAPERDALVALLRSLTKLEKIAVLTTTAEIPGLASTVDRLLSLTNGVLRGNTVPPAAPVVPLRQAAPA